MGTIREIENAIERLSPGEFKEFRQWLAEFEAAAWDRQIEEDSKAGRLDALMDEALEDLNNGRCKDL